MAKLVGYAFVVCDLLHHGHINFLLECKKHCDYLVVGVYTDKLVMSYKRKPIFPLNARLRVVKNLKMVDEVRVVKNKDATPMLKKLRKEGHDIKYLFHGDDWKDVEGKDYIESIGGKLIQPKYTKEISTSIIIERIKKY